MIKLFTNKIFYWTLLLTLLYSPHCFADNELANEESVIKNDFVNKCLDDGAKDTLNVTWNNFFPYEYQIVKLNDTKLVGLDISIINHLAHEAGYNLKFNNVEWNDRHHNVKEGVNDIILGATYTDMRAEDAYFSLPYRYEENAIFTNKNHNVILDFENINDLLTQIRVQNFKLGIIKQQIYGDPILDEFISSETNFDIIKPYLDIMECIYALNKGEIDGFISERVFGAYALMNNSYNIKEIVIEKKIPIHIMFSKKTVPVSIVRRFNKEIKNFVGTGEYQSMIKNYLYSNLLIQILNTKWFYIISMIGTIGFAISGFGLAIRENMTILRTCIIAIIPSVLGVILKDFIINSYEDGINFSIDYIFISLITILILYIKVLILRLVTKDNSNFILKFMSNLIAIGDALGQSCFFVIGVAASIILQMNPIIITPIIAIIVSHLGLAIRNIILTDKFVDELNVEITLFWSSILTLYFYFHSLQLNFNKIEFIIVISIIGCFITKLLTHYLRIPNLYFPYINCWNLK
jgi:polar amino acid transport system substrate-binding protein